MNRWFLAALLFCGLFSFGGFARDLDGLTELHLAARRGDLLLVRQLLKDGADLFSLDSKMGVSVLHKAVYSGNAAVVEELLQQGALINLQSPSNGDTALHDAIYFKHGDDQSVINALLSHHPNLSVQNRAGLTPLQSAQVLKDTATIKALQDILQAQLTSSEIALFKAIQDDDLSQAKSLVGTSQVDLKKRNEQGFSPLLLASRSGRTALVRLLLENGADPNQLDEWMGANSGHKAAFWDRPEVMTLLIQHGLDINAKGAYNGYTALHDATARNHVEVVKILLAAGARKDIHGHDSKTPLDIARDNKNKNLIELLTKN
jgi:ankyrin repeat protein